MVGTSRPQRSQSSSVRSRPTRPAIARRWITALVEPPIAPLVRIAFSKACSGQDVRGLQVVLDHLHDAPAGQMRHHPAAAVDRRDRGIARQRHAQRLGHARHRRGGAHGVAGAGRRGSSPASASRNSAGGHLAGLHRLGELPQMRCPSRPVRRGTSRSASARRRPGSSAGRRWPPPSAALGVVLSQPTSSTTPSIGWPRMRFLDRPSRQRLRNIIAVGRKRALAGPRRPATRPAGRRPRRCRASPARARSRRWALQGVELATRCCRCRSPGGRRTGRRAGPGSSSSSDGRCCPCWCRRTIPASADGAAMRRV